MNEFQIKPATRTGVKPLVGFYGRSGSGKTMSALLFARGLAGPTGRITLIDSESGRGSLFADLIPGGYNVLEIEPPFSSERYLAAFEAAEQISDVIVEDSMSHEWAGEGGVLDAHECELDRMAGDDWKKREACKLAGWIKPKRAHKKMVQRLLRSKVALICCLRGEEKTHIIKEGGKSKVITDEFSSPLYDKDFIFELLLNFEMVARDGVGGYVIPRKITHPAIASMLPKADQQIGIAHGQALAQWCANPGTAPAASPSPATPKNQPPKPEAATAKRPTDATRGWMVNALLEQFEEQAVTQYAIDKGCILPTETLRDWSLTNVCTSKGALIDLIADIDAWKKENNIA